MSSYVSPADLVSTIGNWYHAIIRRDVEAATRLKKVVEELLIKESVEDEISLYYELTDFRHMLISENYSEGDYFNKIQVINSLSTVENSSLNCLTNFLYGQYEFLQGSYARAIRYYQATESELDQLVDPYEKADFYHRMGETYYRIDQYVSAIHYLELAYKTFKENPLFTERALNSLMLLGCVYAEMREFTEAESLFSKVLQDSSHFPTTHAFALRNFGLSLLQSNKLEGALDYFTQALKTGNHWNTFEGTKTKYNLALVYFRLHQLEDAKNYLKVAMTEAEKYGNTEYIARCKIVKGLYLESNMELVMSGFKILENGNFYFECAEMANEVSVYMERTGENQQAFSFLKKALEYRNFQLKSRSDIS
ncbi:response regulator aspartate phosphatase [Geomicrobium sp. JCM 19037]|uniref:response regulator aspartate phosphatase n=1 Tax=unclassified Geomicrobium TaxID=2628951 RepID=UPI00045F4D53|nr:MULTISPECIES: hypothetical protein [unclassified Geomicrobium]GAK02661.1 response regulator aspartate phosphatase [Geomicrobium sp. JCM 19037]GAK11710.1 response regulator aspartate phosphatase [Geomicrobium sp. JCM 19039]